MNGPALISYFILVFVPGIERVECGGGHVKEKSSTKKNRSNLI